MRSIFVLFLAALIVGCQAEAPTEEAAQPVVNEAPAWSIAIHGGAGHFDSESYSEAEQEAYAASLERALTAGSELLEGGMDAISVVEQVIRIMEDDSLFNAGKGAVFTSEVTHELDASIMDGATRNAGAVTGIQSVRNPISAARLVMDSSVHVFLSGEGATQFAMSYDLDSVPNSYFDTHKAKKRYERAKQKNNDKMGTVGCVVLDKQGNLAAGTSTGGMTWKKHGRIGDSPVIGAGTYADNRSCAVSCTGHGEYFIRASVAQDIHARMLYKNIPLQQAAEEVVMKELVDLGGTGGIIAAGSKGEIALVFNTSGMFRASQRAGEEPFVAMFK